VNLDEYWVLSWLMQYSISHTSAGRAALAIIAAAAILLLVLAASANAEGTNVVAAVPGPVGVSPVSSEQDSPPTATAESVDAPEPVEVTEAEPVEMTGAATAGDTTSTTATESEAPATPSPAAAAPDLPSTSTLPSTAARPEAATGAGLRTPVRAEPDAVTASTHLVSEPVEQIRQDTAVAIAPSTGSAKTVAQAVNPAASIDRVHTLSHPALQAAGTLSHPALQAADGALHRGPLDLATPDTVENLLPPAGADVGPFSHHGASSTLPTAAYPYVQVTILDDSSLQNSGGPGGVEPLQLEAPSATGNPAVDALARVPVDTAEASLDDVGGGAESLASPPLDGNAPTPFPDSPSMAASGSGGSIFVPIAPLLALLALAAPAILRRLREVPDFAAPTPFVCALERPG